MTESTVSMALRVLGGLISTAWLGLSALAVIVFGAGGWESWPRAPSPHPRPVIPPTPPAHGLPPGLALVIGVIGTGLLWLAIRRVRRR
jgi:hypothetical protein